MKVFVTGAAGFLGREVVVATLRAHHEVTALVRPGDSRLSDLPADIVYGDLRAPRDDWTNAARAADVVIHAAAAASGPRGAHLANTIVATERLLGSLEQDPPARFVHISSFSVYDFHALAVGAVLDENSALEQRPRERDAYTEAKLEQERLVREWCLTHSVPCVIVRPAAIVGPGKDWGGGAAMRIGRLAFVVAPRSRFPVAPVAACAEAIAHAVHVTNTGVVVVNLVGDPLPTFAQYFKSSRRRNGSTDIYVPVPWLALSTIGRTLAFVDRHLLAGRLRTPELFHFRRQEVRWKPLRYSNQRARQLLGWSESPNSRDLDHGWCDDD